MQDICHHVFILHIYIILFLKGFYSLFYPTFCVAFRICLFHGLLCSNPAFQEFL
jgi:hypothetical protein